MRPSTLALVTSVLAALIPGVVEAHSGRSVSHSTLRVDGATVGASLRATEEDLLELLALDADRDGRVSPEEMDAAKSLVLGYLRNNFVVRTVSPAGEAAPCPMSAGAAIQSEGGPAADGRRWRFELRFACPLPPEDLELRCTLFQGGGFTHEHRATVQLGGVTRLFFFDGKTRQARIAISVGEQLAAYLWHGVTHIALGYDHLVFLFGLLLVGATFRRLLAIVTSFTVAHSITLALGALDVVRVPTIVVESTIALTIAYVGAENVVARGFRWRWLVTFALGLVHGFGFASALAETGLPTKAFALTLVTFNVGVELGQLALVLAAWPLLRWLSRQRAYAAGARAASIAIFLFGVALFVMRAFFDVG